MELARAEADLVAELASQWLARGRKPLARLPVAVQRQVIQEQLHRLGRPGDFELVESLRNRPDQPVPVGPGQCLVLAPGGLLRVQTSEKPVFQTGSLRLNLNRRRRGADFGGVKLTWEMADNGGMNFTRQPNVEHFDAGKVGAAVCLRHWQPGDRFHQIGAAGPAKLQDIFTNLKVPLSERRRRLVATTRGGEIFWVEGLRIGEGFKLDKTTVRRLDWRWQRTA
jgi:tRNA(Ile)-lysidine synthase